MQCKRTFVQRKRSLFSQYALLKSVHTAQLCLMLGKSQAIYWNNWMITQVWILYIWIVYMRVYCIFFQEARRHFAELNGGSWADSYHSRRQSDRHYHRHCPSVPLAATSTLSFRGISFVLEYNLLRNLISNTIQSTFPMRQVKISWVQVMHLFAAKK